MTTLKAVLKTRPESSKTPVCFSCWQEKYSIPVSPGAAPFFLSEQTGCFSYQQNAEVTEDSGLQKNIFFKVCLLNVERIHRGKKAHM